MVRQARPQENTKEVLRKKPSLLYSQVLETGGWRSMQDHTGKTPGWQEEEDRSEKKDQAVAFIGVVVGEARRDRGDSLALTSSSKFSRLWAIGVVSSCLVPGCGMTKAEEYCLLGWIEEVWLWMVSLYIERYVPG